MIYLLSYSDMDKRLISKSPRHISKRFRERGLDVSLMLNLSTVLGKKNCRVYYNHEARE